MHAGSREYPQPKKLNHALSKHDDQRVDPYFWMRERENPEVVKHLKAENDYTALMMKPVAKLEKELFTELKSRVKEDDSTVPVKDGNYYYAARYEMGAQYPLYVRHKGSPTAPEEIILNEPELAKNHSYFESSGPMMSPSHDIMAYAVDTVGRRFYTIYFKDLRTGKMLPDKIENVRPGVAWGNDNETIFYTQHNPETLRTEKVFRYSLKTHKSELIYFEKDETFSVGVGKSLSDKFIYLVSGSTLTSEVQYLSADHPHGTFKIFTPRQREHEYSVDDNGKQFFIVSNRNAKNHKVMVTDLDHTDEKHWKELIPHRPDVYVENITVFKNYLVLDERTKGLARISIYDHKGQNPYVIPFKDSAYLVSVGDNREFDTDLLRFEYESMRQPPSVYDLHLKTHAQELKKQKEVPNYDPELYRTERLFIKVRDGAEVPVSLVMKKDLPLDGTAPMLVYGYGSYGANMDPWFSSSAFSLVNRGFVYAIAHIRGGSEMGREWYDNGRTMNKKNTFYDFIDCTEGLVKLKYANRHRIYAMGGSAGGLLMGAVMNERPDLYNGMVAQVPFVDVITTMLDDTIPLTTSEYDEWGNPNEKAAYDYIKSYSPYDNVTDKKYPNVLVTTGFHDSQVQYWEPAKWVAKLRDHNKASTMILLKTDLEAGHGGASGRFDQLKEKATEFAFILEVDQKAK
ncbi:S9 family peptidase [Bdellovibrio sp. HCB2-146]|uniref:S9 family peptidase n=1 Tax=Bdellovibrio sp. HCB2-146 TaxID=3394362 RepID=UPI0039BD5060